MVGAAQGVLDVAENRIHPSKLGALDSGSPAAHHHRLMNAARGGDANPCDRPRNAKSGRSSTRQRRLRWGWTVKPWRIGDGWFRGGPAGRGVAGAQPPSSKNGLPTFRRLGSGASSHGPSKPPGKPSDAASAGWVAVQSTTLARQLRASSSRAVTRIVVTSTERSVLPWCTLSFLTTPFQEQWVSPNDPKQMHWKGEIKAGWALIAGILCLPQSRKTRRRRTTSREAKQSRFEASLQQ